MRAHVGLVDVLVRKLAPAERARVHVVARMQVHVHPNVVPGMRKLSLSKHLYWHRNFKAL